MEVGSIVGVEDGFDEGIVLLGGIVGSENGMNDYYLIW